MEYGAIDLHKKESQVRILREGGEIIDRRITATRDRSTVGASPTSPTSLNPNHAGDGGAGRPGVPNMISVIALMLRFP
jgi:hypothetical protein